MNLLTNPDLATNKFVTLKRKRHITFGKKDFKLTNVANMKVTTLFMEVKLSSEKAFINVPILLLDVKCLRAMMHL